MAFLGLSQGGFLPSATWSCSKRPAEHVFIRQPESLTPRGREADAEELIVSPKHNTLFLRIIRAVRAIIWSDVIISLQHLCISLPTRIHKVRLKQSICWRASSSQFLPAALWHILSFSAGGNPLNLKELPSFAVQHLHHGQLWITTLCLHSETACVSGCSYHMCWPILDRLAATDL